MNYNYNQYGQYPYQPMQQYIPLTFVSGIEGAKAYIVAPNQTVYLRDSDSDTIFIKTADAQGRYTLNTYTLVPVTDANKAPVYASVESLKVLEDKINKLEALIGGTKHE